MQQSINDLATEQKVLSQLVYRNHNQHSSTKLFSYFKSLNRNLSLLTSEKLLVVVAKLESSLRAAAQSKVSQIDMKDVFTGHAMTSAAAHLAALSTDISLRCSVCVRRLLGKKVFLPLYSMFLALSARIFTCLSSILDHFIAQGGALTTQLKHLELTQPRLSKCISEHLSSRLGAFTDVTINVHKAMHTMAKECITPTVTASSTGGRKIIKADLAGKRNMSILSLHSHGSVQDVEENQKTLSADYDDKGDEVEDSGLLIGGSLSATTGTVATHTNRNVNMNINNNMKAVCSVNEAGGADSPPQVRAEVSAVGATTAAPLGTADVVSDFDSMFLLQSTVHTAKGANVNSSTSALEGGQTVEVEHAGYQRSMEEIPNISHKSKDNQKSSNMNSNNVLIKLKQKSSNKSSSSGSSGNSGVDGKKRSREDEEESGKKTKKKAKSSKEPSGKSGRKGKSDDIDDIFGGL